MSRLVVHWLGPLEWLWRGKAIRAVATRLAASESARTARQRAQTALELGLDAEEPAEPFGREPSASTACEHYAAAARAALEALASAAAAPASGHGPSDALLLRAAGGDATRLARLQARLEQPSASLSPAEQTQGTAELRVFATVLVEAARADEAELSRLRRQRRWRLAACTALLGFGISRAVPALDGADWRVDLAAGKPWRTSSAAFRCEPAAKRCDDHFGTTIFFHTRQDESPWLVIDLEREETISAVRVRNRTDCCSSLAVPLVVELSNDNRTWREVARRERNFRNWVPSFAPTAARWVRLRVDRPSALHLERVSVYR